MIHPLNGPTAQEEVKRGPEADHSTDERFKTLIEQIPLPFASTASTVPIEGWGDRIHDLRIDQGRLLVVEANVTHLLDHTTTPISKICSIQKDLVLCDIKDGQALFIDGTVVEADTFPLYSLQLSDGKLTELHRTSVDFDGILPRFVNGHVLTVTNQVPEVCLFDPASQTTLLKVNPTRQVSAVDYWNGHVLVAEGSKVQSYAVGRLNLAPVSVFSGPRNVLEMGVVNDKLCLLEERPTVVEIIDLNTQRTSTVPVPMVLRGTLSPMVGATFFVDGERAVIFTHFTNSANSAMVVDTANNTLKRLCTFLPIKRREPCSRLGSYIISPYGAALNLETGSCDFVQNYLAKTASDLTPWRKLTVVDPAELRTFTYGKQGLVERRLLPDARDVGRYFRRAVGQAVSTTASKCRGLCARDLPTGRVRENMRVVAHAVGILAMLYFDVLIVASNSNTKWPWQ